MKEFTIDRVPSITWHFLKINDKNIMIPDEKGAAKVRPYSDVKSLSDEEKIKFNDKVSKISSASGEEFSEYLKEASSDNSLYIDANEELSFDIEFDTDDKTFSAAALNLSVGAGKKAVAGAVMAGRGHGFGAVRTRIVMEEGSCLTLVQVHNFGDDFEFINDTAAVLGKNASLRVLHIILAGKSVNIGTLAELRGDGSSYQQRTGYICKGSEDFDFNYNAVHYGRNVTSDIDARGSLSGNASKTMRQTIDFRRGCAGADGKENESVLIIDDGVINRSLPLILCQEEDVAGEHGASIGEVSEDILMYMESRGIGRDEVYRLLSKGNILSVARDIPDDRIREAVLTEIDEGEE